MFAVGVVSALDFSDLKMFSAFIIKNNDYPDKVLTRGEALDRIVTSFNLKTEKQTYIADCLAHADECFFVFAAMSDFDDIKFEPLTLYPDVSENSRYYESINIASMLGLVHGYLNEDGTPFHTELVITRIQSLKIVLASAELMKWKEKFELEGTIQESVFADVDVNDPAMWWYPRYINFALRTEIIEEGEYFRPNDPITVQELAEFVDNTLKYRQDNADDMQIYARGDSK
jgi:hypothetical protein